MHATSLVLGVTACAALLAGCNESPSSRLWSESAITVPTSSEQALTIDPDVQPLIDIYLVKSDGSLYKQSTGKPSEQSLYRIVDVSRVIANPALGASTPAIAQDRRDKIVRIALGVADHNHEIYFNRVFRTYLLAHATRNILHTVFTGSTAVTALFSGTAAAGVAAGNLVVDSAVSEMDATLFVNQTFNAIDKAVTSERARVRADIEAKLAQRSNAQYDITQAIPDVQRYSNISSFRMIAQIMADAGTLKEKDNKGELANAPAPAPAMRGAARPAPNASLNPTVTVSP